MKIAVCDADVKSGSFLEVELIKILELREVGHDIEVFESGESLCKELKRQHFDLIFLSITLSGMSGIEVSKYIREQLKNYIVKIAYILGQDVSATDVCEFAPVGYLVRPLEQERIVRIIERYFIIKEQIKQVFYYKKRTMECAVPYCEIMYFESNAHKIIVNKIDGQDAFYGTIESIYEELKNKDFLHIHKSFIVNCHFIKNYDIAQVEMIDGKKLPISRSKRKEISEKYEQIHSRE